MCGRFGMSGIAGALSLAFCLSGAQIAPAQDKPADQPPEITAKDEPAHSLGRNPGEIAPINQLTGTAGDLLEVPMSHVTPGGVKVEAGMKNPMENDPGSAQRGKKYFTSFNCVGCHAPDGGGGMGPSLSDGASKFGDDPADIYLVISHGAPLGMPSWGASLPDNVIWDLVSYVQAMSKGSGSQWGTTASVTAGLPALEQVPAEFKSEIEPWEHVEPFSHGQKPTEATSDAGPIPPPPPEQPLQ